MQNIPKIISDPPECLTVEQGRSPAQLQPAVGLAAVRNRPTEMMDTMPAWGVSVARCL